MRVVLPAYSCSLASYTASWYALSPAGAGAGTKVGNKAYPVNLEELDKELGCAI